MFIVKIMIRVVQHLALRIRAHLSGLFLLKFKTIVFALICNCFNCLNVVCMYFIYFLGIHSFWLSRGIEAHRGTLLMFCRGAPRGIEGRRGTSRGIEGFFCRGTSRGSRVVEGSFSLHLIVSDFVLFQNP